MYPTYYPKKRKIKPIYFLITFVVALSGAYLAQVYWSDIFDTQNQQVVERLTYEMPENIAISGTDKDSATIIEQAMQSVVGISKLQANEESIFDVAVSQKWGLRDRNDSNERWVYINESAFSRKCWDKTNCQFATRRKRTGKSSVEPKGY